MRCYSAPAGLSKAEVEGRIIDLLKNFDKVQNDELLWMIVLLTARKVTDASKVCLVGPGNWGAGQLT
jgi:hypothetical protein